MPMSITIDTPEGINACRLLVLKGALKLETIGMTRSRGNAAVAVRGILGVKTRSKAELLAQYEQYLRGQGIL